MGSVPVYPPGLPRFTPSFRAWQQSILCRVGKEPSWQVLGKRYGPVIASVESSLLAHPVNGAAVVIFS